MIVTGIGALLRGGRVERLGIALFAAGWLLSLAAQTLTSDLVFTILLALIDAGVMLGLISLTWKSPRPWPAIACGFQAIALATGAAKWLDPNLNPNVYLGLLAVAGYGAVGALAIGAWLHPVPLEK